MQIKYFKYVVYICHTYAYVYSIRQSRGTSGLNEIVLSSVLLFCNVSNYIFVTKLLILNKNIVMGKYDFISYLFYSR